MSDQLPVLISSPEIDRRVEELARDISEYYRVGLIDGIPRHPLMVPVLKGAYIFAAQLSLKMTVHHELDFLEISSYGGEERREGIQIVKPLTESVFATNVLVVEDIVDTGYTLHFVRELLLRQGASSVRVVTLLNKKARRAAHVHADWIGFEIEDKFVVGYGMDYNGKYRGLPYITDREDAIEI